MNWFNNLESSGETNNINFEVLGILALISFPEFLHSKPLSGTCGISILKAI
jgi:hypothetical protein